MNLEARMLLRRGDGGQLTRMGISSPHVRMPNEHNPAAAHNERLPDCEGHR